MNGFSVGRAFSETFGFLKDNWLSMLLWMGGAVLVLAAIFFVMLGGNLAAIGGGGEPDPTAAMGFVAQIFLFAILAMVVLYAAGMMIWRMGLAPDASSGDIGWALLAGGLYAFAMLVMMIAAYIVITIVAFIVMLFVGASSAGAMSLFSGDPGAAISGGLLIGLIFVYVAFIVFWLWFQGRLMSAGPIMAHLKMTNPFTAIGESWRMSGPSQWKVTGFLIVFTIVTYLILFVAFLAFGAIGGGMSAAGGSSTAMVVIIIMALLVYLPFLMVWMSVPAGVYRALGGGQVDDEDVFG